MRLAARPGQRLAQVGRVADDPHPLPAATGRRLDEERVADALALRGERGVVLLRAVVARDGRDAARRRAAAGLGLVAHRGDRVSGRPDPAQPGRGHRPRELRVLGEEAVAGVDGVGAGPPCDRDDRVAVEVARDLVGLVDAAGGTVVGGVDADDAHAEPMGRPRHACGDFTAVRDEQRPDRSSGWSRRRPRRRRTATNATPGHAIRARRWEAAVGDPALDGPDGHTELGCNLSRRQVIGMSRLSQERR